MTTLPEFVLEHTVRGECRCGRCVDVREEPPNRHTGHTVDLVILEVSAKNDPCADEFRSALAKHTGVHCDMDPYDGKEHSYLEIGGWIGDQGWALLLMGLGALLGEWDLLTPTTLLPGLPDEMAMEMAGQGMVAIKHSVPKSPPPSPGE